MFENITIIGMIPPTIGVIITLLIGFKIGKFFSVKQGKREMKLIDKERENSSRSYKKLLDDENVEVLSENERLKDWNAKLVDQISDYRKKLAGMGKLSFSNNRKRADILYSLLLENEAFEQILTDLNKKKPDEKSEYLLHQMNDVQKRHQLLSKIFDKDGAIKNHVRTILFNKEKIESAEPAL